MGTFSGMFSVSSPHITGRLMVGKISSLLAWSAMLALPVALWAQGSQGPNPGNIPSGVAAPGGMYRSFNGLQHLNLEVNMKLGQVKEEWQKTGRDSVCFFAPLNTVHDLTVGAASLSVPKDAKKEYGKACDSVLSGKNDEAEKHLRKAIEIFPQYAASWVLLGQILEQRSSLPEAKDACEHALAGDDHYLQAYICLADVAGRQGNWQEVLNQADRALALDPTNTAAAYEYQCAASLSLQKLPEAEASALKAQDIQAKAKDKEKSPRIHILLAQIYDQKGETAKEADQLREILKMVSDPQAKAQITQALTELDKQTK